MRLNIRPSSANIWAGRGCTAHPHMVAKFPEGKKDNTAAEEGTAAHWVAENLLLGATPETLPELAPNGVPITAEMVEAVLMYVDYVDSLAGTKWVERKIGVLGISSGTPDLAAYDIGPRVLEIVDYKHGFNSVDPYNNWQLGLYAGAYIHSALNHLPTMPLRVKLTIVQPRAFSRSGVIRTWEPSLERINEMRIQAMKKAHEVEHDPRAVSSPDCRYCPGRHACPAAIKAGLNLFEAATEPMPYDMEPDALALLYSQLMRAHEQIGFLMSGCEAQIKDAIYKGASVPGYSLEQKVGALSWNVPAGDVEKLGALLGVPLTEVKPITPNQAVKKGIDSTVISGYTSRGSKGSKLVTVNTNQANRIFT